MITGKRAESLQDDRFGVARNIYAPRGAHELQGAKLKGDSHRGRLPQRRGEKVMNDMTQAELDEYRKEARSVAFYEVIELIHDGKTVEELLQILKEKVKR